MGKLVCPRCSKGIEILPDRIVWAELSRTIVSWLDGKPIALLQWFWCGGCQHTYFLQTNISEEVYFGTSGRKRNIKIYA